MLQNGLRACLALTPTFSCMSPLLRISLELTKFSLELEKPFIYMILLLTKNRFYLIMPSKDLLAISSFPLNARLLEDRLTILKVVINIFRILITLKEFTPVNTVYALYRTVFRENDVTVGNPSLSNEIRIF